MCRRGQVTRWGFLPGPVLHSADPALGNRVSNEHACLAAGSSSSLQLCRMRGTKCPTALFMIGNERASAVPSVL
eukprot:scaffold33198_cov54-Phaeocystis_antarctica.AAC.4